MSNSFNVFGFVDILGDSVTRTFAGYVDIISEPTLATEILIGDQNNTPKPLNGVLTDGEYIVSGARVSCLQNNMVVDYCRTGDDGKYNLFVKPGVYTIQIACDALNTEFANEEILPNEGLINQYYCIIDNKTSLIKKRYDDVLEFCGTTKKMVSGRMLDSNKRPVSNAEIIISKNGEIQSYIITDETGKYSFAIDNGTYDIRIRNSRQPVKVINNFEFKDGSGFMTELQKQSNLLRRDAWIWICN